MALPSSHGRFHVNVFYPGDRLVASNSIYNIRVSNTKYRDVFGFGIVEPGATVEVYNTYHNEGGMATPSHQDVVRHFQGQGVGRVSF